MKLAPLLFALLLGRTTWGSIDDFEDAVEVTTAGRFLPGPVQLYTVGRTRQTKKIRKELVEAALNHTLDSRKVDRYCCFWVYQDHPAIPEVWEHRREYPFDFVENGWLVKNQRNFQEPQKAELYS
ncbi:uncharacterized protein LOC115621623 [Scaptodrosophila lebanonensis]|uniref:Uncharacterized protein LOC115621623 n=1 Tax=Drosophila lebanonensis TaxID=7225 RepID=A0A6J2T7R8_DROLE|nr:uncharacterized protein LOC115621623 [Scaptodrosophila lebanonensis]